MHTLFSFDQVLRSRELGGRHFDWVAWDLVARNARLYPDREAMADTLFGVGAMRRRTWNEVFHAVNTIILNLLEAGFPQGGRLLSHLPSALESAYLDPVTSKLRATHLGLNVDLGKAETLGVIREYAPDVAVIVADWHGRPFAEWYREAMADRPGLQVYVLSGPDEPVPEGMRPLADLLDERVWTRYRVEDLAYLRTDPLAVHELLPTAGTTGVPKISRRTTTDWFHVHSVCIAERAGLTPYDSRVLIGPLSGGSGRLWGVHTPLYSGGRVIYLTEFDEAAVLALTERERLTVWTWNPALITRVVTSPAFAHHDLASLRLVCYSGAPLAREVIERLLERGATAFNVYGTSEVGGAMSPILPGATREQILSAAGVPFEGFDVPVVDGRGERLGPGEVGEILIWNIHHGYWNRREESVATYHDQEWGGRFEGYQRTGDLGMYDRDGYLRIVGRKKDMILRGAQNIFPKELEDILSEHPQIREVAVVGMADAVLGQRVAVFVVPKEERAAPSLGALTAFLADRGVAKFKWPERLELRQGLPMGPGGKVQKDQLRAWLDHPEG